jgi:integrase
MKRKMSKAITAENYEWYQDMRIQERLLEVDTCLRNKAFLSAALKSFQHISQLIQIKKTDVDYQKEALSIACLKKRLRTRCPNCKEGLLKKYRFCPSCGNALPQNLHETMGQRHKILVPIDRDTLGLIEKYLSWRSRYPYSGELLFPFSRQRGWQLIEKFGRRAGFPGIHPESLRHLLATRWINKGLDVRILKFLMGYSGAVTYPPLFSFEQIKEEYLKLWEP